MQILKEKMNGELPPHEFVSLSKEYARLEPVVGVITRYQKLIAGYILKTYSKNIF